MTKIEDLVREYGVNNIRAFIPMQAITCLHGLGLPLGITSSDDPYTIVECKINEDRYKVEEGYKITFESIKNTDEEFYGSDTFYQMDFDSLRRRNPDEYRIYVLVDADEKYERIN